MQLECIEESSISVKAIDFQSDSNISQHSDRENEIKDSDSNECSDGFESQKNQAFEVAIQKRQYGAAECILRDLSLKEAVQKGIK